MTLHEHQLSLSLVILQADVGRLVVACVRGNHWAFHLYEQLGARRQEHHTGIQIPESTCTYFGVQSAGSMCFRLIVCVAQFATFRSLWVPTVQICLPQLSSSQMGCP